jgi:hypothetical protein
MRVENTNNVKKALGGRFLKKDGTEFKWLMRSFTVMFL